MEKHFEEEINWISDKIDYLKKADKTGIYKDEIRMLRRIKNNYEHYKSGYDKLSKEKSWRDNPDPGF